MIEVISPGWLSLIVDDGRYGYADYGVPSSSALDLFAYKKLNVLLNNQPGTPAIEVMGSNFSLKFYENATFAITGAKVEAVLDEKQLQPWSSFYAKKDSVLKVTKVIEGMRYYVGFSGIMNIEKTMNSFSTNLECGFGGLGGKPLIRGDKFALKGLRPEEPSGIAEKDIPSLNPPHTLHLLEGPEMEYFSSESLSRLFEKKIFSWYKVSSKLNRTGIRLEGEPLAFKKGAVKSIVSDGIMPGTVQIPGDGLPIIMLHERTIGGYARLGIIIKADHDLLAHLKPEDMVRFEMVGN